MLPNPFSHHRWGRLAGHHTVGDFTRPRAGGKVKISDDGKSYADAAGIEVETV